MIYRGLAKTNLQQQFNAAAVNLYRLAARWTGTPPRPPEPDTKSGGEGHP